MDETLSFYREKKIGLVLFMFIVGYELDHRLVRGRQRVAVSVSIGSGLMPWWIAVGPALVFGLVGLGLLNKWLINRKGG